MNNIKTFKISELSTLTRKDTKQVIEYLQTEIPNEFVTMSSLIEKFGSNARTHVKSLEGISTFRIKRFDKNGKSKKETDFWTFVVCNKLTKEQTTALEIILKQEKNNKGELRYPNVDFSSHPTVKNYPII